MFGVRQVGQWNSVDRLTYSLTYRSPSQPVAFVNRTLVVTTIIVRNTGKDKGKACHTTVGLQWSVAGVLISFRRLWARSWLHHWCLYTSPKWPIIVSGGTSNLAHSLTLMHDGQCDARPTVTFPAADRRRPLSVPNYTAWWQSHKGVNNLPRVVTQSRHDQQSNPRSTDRMSDAQHIAPLRHPNIGRLKKRAIDESYRTVPNISQGGVATCLM